MVKQCIDEDTKIVMMMNRFIVTITSLLFHN
jgi:hypothetical protein